MRQQALKTVRQVSGLLDALSLYLAVFSLLFSEQVVFKLPIPFDFTHTQPASVEYGYDPQHVFAANQDQKGK